MYNVEVLLQIHGVFASMSTADQWVHKEITLPFPPYKGLSLSLGDWGCTIEDRVELSPSGHESKNQCQIVWDMEEKRFKIYLPSNKEIYWAQLARREHISLDEIVAEYIEMGWEKKEII